MFGGLVVSVVLADDESHLMVGFEPIETLIGETADQVTVRTPSFPAACGASFSVGTSVRVVAFEKDGELWTNSCSQRCWHMERNRRLFEHTFDDEDGSPYDLCGRLVGEPEE
ncbi:MAG: hypothetical protein ABJH52_09765 [Henriciella sp.]